MRRTALCLTVIACLGAGCLQMFLTDFEDTLSSMPTMFSSGEGGSVPPLG